MRTWIRRLFLAGAAMILAVPAFQASAGVDLPKLEKGKGEKCVEETQLMRRNHMEFLKHHRDETMRKGIRTTKHSLKKCVECHASEKTGSVASAKGDFCVACHSYASIKLDCWDCHATKPRSPKTAAAPAGAEAAASPMLAQAKEAAK
jgi:hypothetical protein